MKNLLTDFLRRGGGAARRRASLPFVALALFSLCAEGQTIQERVDACAAAGGGRVVVAAGEWRTGPIHLRSNVELHLAEGAKLVFSANPDDYRPLVRSSFSGIECLTLSPLVYAYGCTNVALTGKGTLAPEMDVWRVWFDRNTPEMFEAMGRLYAWGESDAPVESRRIADLPGARFRPCCVEFERCRNVRLEGFRVRESPLWTVHLRLCEDVHVQGLDLEATGHNNDGIDIDACRRVLVEDCTFLQGDDGIVIKSGRDRDGRRVGVPCEEVEIRNCTARGGHTLLAIGSEVSGGVRNITLHDCRATGPLSTLVFVKTSARKGAFIENVSVSHVTATALGGAVLAVATDTDYQWRKYPPRELIRTRIANLSVRDVCADSADVLYRLAGDPKLPVRGVTLENVRVGEVARGEGSVVNVEGFVKNGIVTRISPRYAAEVEERANALAKSVFEPSEKYATWSAFYERLFALDADADAEWAKISSLSDFDVRRKALRGKMLARMGGLPERAPLNAKITGVVRREGYRIEKILFESRPGAFVTGNLYVPERPCFVAPYPAVIEVCGHAREGKVAPKYRRIAVLAAKNGLAAFVVDPLGQGERFQSPEEDANLGSPVANHLRMGVNALLLGHGLAAFEIWDAMCALDYLDTRMDLRHDGYGAMGNSGGGTQSVMLSAVDDRIKSTATSCFLCNLREQTMWRLLPDCEQMIFGQLADGINHAAYPLLGGNPLMMLARRDDMIPYSGTLATARLLQDVGRNIGRGNWYSFASSPGPHGYNEEQMRRSVDFLARHLRGVAATFDEPEFDSAKQDFGPDADELLVAPKGGVQSLDGFKSFYGSLNEELDAAVASRPEPDREARAKTVRERADIDENRVGARVVVSESVLSDGTKVFYTFRDVSDGYKMPVVELIPKDAERYQPLVLAIDGARTNGAELVRANGKRAIFIPDLCACGEIGAARHHYACPYDDEETAKMLYLMGASLVGRRAGELVALGQEAKRRFGKNPTVVTTGRLAVAAAHAIAAVPGLFTDHEFIAPPMSWTQAVRTRAQSLYSTSVQGALLQYDWTDLLENR